MIRSTFGILAACSALLLTACADDDDSKVAESGAEGGGGSDQKPFRDACETVIDQPFPFLAPDGSANIRTLSVGGTETSDNFANRGDIVVLYEDTDRITIEMCRFTMASSKVLAEDDFKKLELWAYADTGSPKRPKDMDAEDDCIDRTGTAAWRDDCRVRVWFDGRKQKSRTGADLRVTLPQSYIYALNLTTEDNIADADYQNRGDVCVEGLRGSADIELGSGQASVIMAADAISIPECPADLRLQCEEVSWDPDLCSCFSDGHRFSRTEVSSHDASASNITVDLPGRDPSFWASLSLINEGQQTPDAAPACADTDAPLGARCDACVDPALVGYVLDPTLGAEDQRSPWRNAGALNYPGDPATQASGYTVRLVSKTCQAVPSTSHPDDFVGRDNGSHQDLDERGNITVCDGCLRDAGCDALIDF